jgi:hypothetical protein
MKEVIVYNPKRRPVTVFDVSTRDKEREAFQHLFEVFDGRFAFGSRIERAQEDIKRFQDALDTEPSEAHEEDYRWVECARAAGYIESMPVEKIEEGLKSAREKIERLGEYKELYNRASNGDAGAATALVKWLCNEARGGASYKRVEVKNT